MVIHIQRIACEENQTLGILDIPEAGFNCKTLELPWLNNQQYISCIPTGTYQGRKHNSPKFGETIHILNVPDRSEILIHKGNYNKDTLGCILLGRKHSDIDGDGVRDVTSSAATMREFLSLIPHDVTIIIN